MMDTIPQQESWNEHKDKLKQKFAVLMENDRIFEEGRKEEMFDKLQIILGKTNAELQKLIEPESQPPEEVK